MIDASLLADTGPAQYRADCTGCEVRAGTPPVEHPWDGAEYLERCGWVLEFNRWLCPKCAQERETNGDVPTKAADSSSHEGTA